MTMLRRLLRYLHSAVFDRSPHAELAFRLSSNGSLTWRVADDELIVTIPDPVSETLLTSSGDLFLLSDGSLLLTDAPRTYIGVQVPSPEGYISLLYDLSSRTMGQLVSDLSSDGFSIDGVSASFLGLSSTVLVEGDGDTSRSNGDHVRGFTSILWSLFSSFALELRIARFQIGEALRQMVITQAEGEWLDLWGTLYDVPRKAGDTDAAYAPTIPREAFRRRVNAFAIEQAIRDATGRDVRIEEPWGSIFRLDESALSGESRFYDGSGVGYHLILPVSYETFDWTEVLAVIERNRAAGVIVLPPETRLRAYVDATVDGTIFSSRISLFSSIILSADANRLDYMVLSGEIIARTYSSFSEERTYSLDFPETPEEIYSSSREMIGYTWGEMGEWTMFSWDADPDEVERLLRAGDRLWEYANFDLNEDLPD